MFLATSVGWYTTNGRQTSASLRSLPAHDEVEEVEREGRDDDAANRADVRAQLRVKSLAEEHREHGHLDRTELARGCRQEQRARFRPPQDVDLVDEENRR